MLFSPFIGGVCAHARARAPGSMGGGGVCFHPFPEGTQHFTDMIWINAASLEYGKVREVVPDGLGDGALATS